MHQELWFSVVVCSGCWRSNRRHFFAAGDCGRHCWFDEFVTGDSASQRLKSASASNLRNVTAAFTDKTSTYSSTPQHGYSQGSNYLPRRPLASQNGPQMLPVRQLAQHGVNHSMKIDAVDSVVSGINSVWPFQKTAYGACTPPSPVEILCCIIC